MNEVSEGSYIKYFTDDHNVVSKYCVVIQPAIKEYLLNNPRSLFIDGTFSKDSGQLFCFSFMDCNHHIQPMGCLYSKSENTNDITILFNELWSSSLSEAKEVSSNEYNEYITTSSLVIMMNILFYDYLLIV